MLKGNFKKLKQPICIEKNIKQSHLENNHNDYQILLESYSKKLSNDNSLYGQTLPTMRAIIILGIK